VFPVAVATAAGWLLLFFVLLALPPASQPSRDEDATPGTEPPAVVSLLAGRLQQNGFVVTLADLAARGWFQLSGVLGPAGPVMCVVPAETPTEPLASYERRVVAHVARRAGVRGEAPAPALSDSFEGGEDAFMHAFRQEVTADAVRRGLTRPRLSGRRIGLLCLVLLAPAGALALTLDAAHHRYPLAIPAVAWVVVAMVTGGIGTSRRPSAAGRAVLERWHAAADASRRGEAAYRGGDARVGAYAAALGRAPGAVAVFAAGRGPVAGESRRPVRSSRPWRPAGSRRPVRTDALTGSGSADVRVRPGRESAGLWYRKTGGGHRVPFCILILINVDWICSTGQS
jgi:hypothetical protein